MKFYFAFFLFLYSLNTMAQFDTSGPINKKAIGIVTEIRKGNSSGSGFLVALGQKRLLVTNKHMIGNWSPVDPLIYIDSITITLYTQKQREESFIKVGIQISNHGSPIPLKVKIHPNPKIDIAVIDITNRHMQLL